MADTRCLMLFIFILLGIILYQAHLIIEKSHFETNFSEQINIESVQRVISEKIDFDDLKFDASALSQHWIDKFAEIGIYFLFGCFFFRN